MTRRMIGVSDSLHMELTEAAKEVGVPMTIVIGTLLSHRGEIDWKGVKANYAENKPTWKNIRKRIADYVQKFPDADDRKLSELTGYSLLQVEVVTYSAHRRCLAELIRDPHIKPADLEKLARVSAKFALRVWQQSKGVTKIPKQEQHLWNMSGPTPVPV